MNQDNTNKLSYHNKTFMDTMSVNEKDTFETTLNLTSKNKNINTKIYENDN